MVVRAFLIIGEPFVTVKEDVKNLKIWNDWDYKRCLQEDQSALETRNMIIYSSAIMLSAARQVQELALCMLFPPINHQVSVLASQ